MNVKILVCCHKKCQLPGIEPYFPIHVGKALSEIDLGIQGDDTGDNISLKNESYCELTGLYWAWKNLKDVDIIGLCHYRRYFDFHGQCDALYPLTSYLISEYGNIDLSVPSKLLHKLDSHSIIAASPVFYEISIYNDYCRCHISDDMRTLEEVFKERDEQLYLEAFNKVMFQNSKLRHYNMFVMKWDLFDEYCNWLFGVLKDVEDRIDISHYDSVQKRIFGYMAERLFNVFIEAKKLKVYKEKVIKFDERKVYREPVIKYIIKRIINYLCFKVMRPIKYQM